MGLGLLTLPAVLLLLCGWRAECTAGFIKSPISEVGLTGEAVELHCEAIGRPIPEIQWWFEADYSNNESFSQLWDGAREERVQINATYISHATSTLYVISLIPEDSGTYECRASNDPDRNHLTKIPRIKWIRSQANVMVIDHPDITTDTLYLSEKTVILSCNLSANSLTVSGHRWLKGSKVLKEDKDSSNTMTYNVTGLPGDGSGQYTCEFLTTPDVKQVINVSVSPQVLHLKASEHGNEGDTGVLTCQSNSFPPVTDWAWYIISPNGVEVIGNGSSDRYVIKSTGNQTVLRISNVDIEKDQKDYTCNATNELGSGGDIIHFHVRSRLAALWPFLGIVGEVLVLVTIIFIYEKRRKPDEVCEDEDSATGALKSNSGANNDNLRQRNSN
ncbi:uncharacterized protein LOC100037021 precursor [Xenopus laevis]|uniref:LOC100037021 protein n=2 Tax=Xenopus laevis TaxID=8355 RepID=A1L3J1_XENLA|nr:Basigin-like precursor [Xenopus laevis]AAI30129.1 LOC100037021 protein [Xenopus laevis]OCU00676.1 hypothetical protein XELAEV_18006455mg [Xenopus laevis]